MASRANNVITLDFPSDNGSTIGGPNPTSGLEMPSQCLLVSLMLTGTSIAAAFSYQIRNEDASGPLLWSVTADLENGRTFWTGCKISTGGGLYVSTDGGEDVSTTMILSFWQ